MGRVLRVSILLAVMVLLACAPEGPGAFVSFNIPPSSDCKYAPGTGSDEFLYRGLYDIATGHNKDSKACIRPYTLNLEVNSFLRANADDGQGRAEPNILQINSAEVLLTELSGAILVFDRGGANLPNPFLVTTNNTIGVSDGSSPAQGIAPVDAIPAAYAPQLNNYIGQQIKAQVQFFGKTTGDVEIDFKPFVYDIEICMGCLVACERRDITDASLTIEDVVGDQCHDNAGADGRICVDPGC